MSAYAVRADLGKYGVNAAALSGISTTAQDAAIEAASEVADSYFRSRYNLPLLAWGTDVTRAVCQIAVYDLLVMRGFNPEQAADQNLQARADSAVAWLRAVGKQEAQANVTPTPVQSPDYDQPRVLTSTPRGW